MVTAEREKRRRCLVTTDEGGIEVRTSIIPNERGSVEKTDSSGGDTHLGRVARPPHSDKNPYFVEDWDVSVLRYHGIGQRRIA